MDLPSDDPAATFDDYADVVGGELEAHGGDDVVVVGHSLAGLTIPLVAARQRVSRLVYLCALSQCQVQASWTSSQLKTCSASDTRRASANPTQKAGADGLMKGWPATSCTRTAIPKRQHERLPDCDRRPKRLALGRIRSDALPGTPASYIICSEDRLVKPDWSESVARERLDADLVELPGSHSPFLSRPADLASVLHDAAP